MQNFKQIILSQLSGIASFSEEAKDAFINITHQQFLKKKEYILQPSQINTHISFIVEGAVREYFLDDKEQEITVWFGLENDFAVSLSSFISMQPSKTGFQCIEDCHLVQFSRNDLYQLYDNFHEMERIGRILTEMYLINIENYHYEFHHLSAQQRYESLCKHRPEICQRVPLQYISSYLGISNETLSRIRAKRF